MNKPQWQRKVTNYKREVWEYVQRVEVGPAGYAWLKVLGYIIKRQNKQKCRDWRVYRYGAEMTAPEFIGPLENMGAREARDVAQLLIGAQQ